MITGIKGVIRRISSGKIYIDTGNLEYEVNVPLNVIYELESRKGEEVRLFIHHQFLQDEQRLYGFLNQSQKDFFAAMQSVKGMGSSLALSLLSHLDGRTLLDIIEKKDLASLTHIPRIGKTTGETLIFEIGRKIDKWRKILSDSDDSASVIRTVKDASAEGAVEALVQLGYKESNARKAILSFCDETGRKADEFTESDLIRGAFRFL
jgi:holliday junction DNA helicase RuvA